MLFVIPLLIPPAYQLFGYFGEHYEKITMLDFQMSVAYLITAVVLISNIVFRKKVNIFVIKLKSNLSGISSVIIKLRKMLNHDEIIYKIGEICVKNPELFEKKA